MVIKITDATFGNEIKSGVTIVDFWAEWCGPCRAIAPLLEELSKKYEGKVKICKLNVDENQDVPTTFGIRSIPTLIAFKDGVKIDVKIGGMPKPVFEDWINSLLAK